MSSSGREGRRARRAYQRRARYDPSAVREVDAGSYVAVHVLADDVATLQRLGMRASDCRNADLWWFTGKVVVLLQLRLVPSVQRSRAVASYWPGHSPAVTVDVHELTTASVEQLMRRLLVVGIPRQAFWSGRARRSLRLGL
ncbi:MAG: hypothetical protein R3B48_22505 [Kofleriaceae bacterium]